MKFINNLFKICLAVFLLTIQNVYGEENQIIDEPKETLKIMDIPSSNTNASLVVSIDSKNDSKNGSI